MSKRIPDTDSRRESEFMDETVLNTPKPTATSTVTRKQLGRDDIRNKHIPFCISPSGSSRTADSSLGIISINSLDVSELMDRSKNETNAPMRDINSKLKQQRLLAYRSLEVTNKAKKPMNLPSRFLKPSDTKNDTDFKMDTANDSTLSETELLKQAASILSENKSMCKSSYKQKTISDTSLYENLSLMSNKIRNSNVSLKDLCEEFNVTNQNQMLDLDSECFVSAENAADKLMADELSWKRHNDLPVNDSKDFMLSANSFGNADKISMGEFFLGKCQDLTELSLRKSPRKKQQPVPLIDASLLSDYPERDFDMNSAIDSTMSIANASKMDGSVMSISQIAKLVSGTEDTPRKIVNYLLKGRDTKQFSEDRVQKYVEDMSRLSYDFVPRMNSTCSEINNADEIPVKYSEHPCAANATLSSIASCASSNVVSQLGNNNNPLHLSALTNKKYVSIENSKDSGYNSTNKGSKLKDSNCRLTDISPNAVKSKMSLVENKENINVSPQNIADRSLTSVRSSSSLGTLQNGKLPIESTRIELIWDCVKAGKISTQEFLLRNRSQKRLRLMITVSGNSFRMLRDRSETELLTSLSVFMHPLESKSFAVAFAPSVVGACVEKLHFVPLFNSDQQSPRKQLLMLYGYGGHASIEVHKVSKDPSGKLWLSLGQLDHSNYCVKEFTVRNTGTLPAFACLSFTSKHMLSFANAKVTPAEFVISPKTFVTVSVMYTPSKEDVKHLNNTNCEVFEIGTVKLISGSEVLRGRIRRLCRKLLKNKEIVDPLVVKLSHTFPNEDMPADLSAFSETVGAMKDLLQQLSTKEMSITLEQDPEKTMIGSIDETTMFQTLYHDHSNMTLFENTILQQPALKLCKVEPRNLILTPPVKCEDGILLSCDSQKAMPFEVKVSPCDGLRVSPADGFVQPGETILLKLSCDKLEINNTIKNFKVSVYVDNDVADVDVKVVLIKNKPAF